MKQNATTDIDNVNGNMPPTLITGTVGPVPIYTIDRCHAKYVRVLNNSQYEICATCVN